MDSRELSEWMVYFAVEPWGQVRGDLQAGIIASTLVNLQLKEDADPLSPTDFLLEFGPKDEDSEEERLDREAEKAAKKSQALSEQLKIAFGSLPRA